MLSLAEIFPKNFSEKFWPLNFSLLFGRLLASRYVSGYALILVSGEIFPKKFSEIFGDDDIDDEDDDPQSLSIWTLCWIARNFFQNFF